MQHSIETKGQSPFTPNHPVSRELFTGRIPQLLRIMERGVGLAVHGKQSYFFIEGDYGIGKSSIALMAQLLAEELPHQLFRINCSLAGAKTVEDVCRIIVEASVRQLERHPDLKKPFEALLRKLGASLEVNVFNMAKIQVNADKLTAEVKSFSTINGLLGYLEGFYHNLHPHGWKGLFLVLDELNGITANRDFSAFLKDLSDQVVTNDYQLPLLLMLCGVPERRQDMLRLHPSIERMFDVLEIPLFSSAEIQEFYERSFTSIQYRLELTVLNVLSHLTPGYPKIMHLIGDEVFWCDTDRVISAADLSKGYLNAVEAFGKKFLGQQVYKAIRTPEYEAILEQAALSTTHLTALVFNRLELMDKLTEEQKAKLTNGLSRLRKLGVIASTGTKNEYAFASSMVKMYVLLKTIKPF